MENVCGKPASSSLVTKPKLAVVFCGHLLVYQKTYLLMPSKALETHPISTVIEILSTSAVIDSLGSLQSLFLKK